MHGARERKWEQGRWGAPQRDGVGAELLVYLLLHVAVRDGDGTRRSVEEVLIGWDLSGLHLRCVAHLRSRRVLNYKEKHKYSFITIHITVCLSSLACTFSHVCDYFGLCFHADICKHECVSNSAVMLV